jgi:RNA polymerase sigma-70 factor (ECF subfamily)
MAASENQTVLIQGYLDRLKAGDESARQDLIRCACGRLERLTRKMLRGYKRVRRWEQTADVLQNALMRLYRALESVCPATPADFFRLAALNIRRELLDMAKHYYGPQGQGAHHATGAHKIVSGSRASLDPAVPVEDPERLAAWTAFHDQIEQLPEEERQLFDLLWYQGLNQAEAAALLNVSERTVKRRWASARLRLHQALGGILPDY